MDAVGRIEQLDPLVRRLLASNPSPFTFTGTQTHMIGRGAVAVIDPGPDIDTHIDAMMSAIGASRVAAILCTHTHRDHSPAARRLKALTGAPVVGCAPLERAGDTDEADEAFDRDYAPDRILSDGERFEGDGWTLEAVATPGHTSNHLCFALAESGILFSGDHVMGWSTSIVSPPDGDMGAYVASLEKLLGRPDRVYYPAHGPVVTDPHKLVRGYILHRRHREAMLLARLERGEGSVPALVETIYRDVDPRLHPAAARSLLAHLIDLEARGLVRQREDIWSIVS